MELKLHETLSASGVLPAAWEPIPGQIIKYPIGNPRLLAALRQVLPGEWKKVVRLGTKGQVLYLEHRSGRVTAVRLLSDGAKR